MNRRFITLIGISILFLFFTSAAHVFAKSSDGKPVVLKYSRWSPSASVPAKIDVKWINHLEEKTQGKVKIKPFFNGALAKMMENYRACQTGIADIAYYVVGINPGLTELNKVIYLPFMGQKDMASGSKAYRELLENIPELQKEFPGMKVLGARMMPPYLMHFTKKDVRVPADLKGMKIIADKNWSLVLNEIGGAPIKLPVGDWYMSLERNLVEGHIVHYPAIFIYKTLDLMKHHTVFGEGGCAMAAEVLLFNEKKWNSLSADLQKAVVDSIDFRTEKQSEGDNALIQKSIQYAKDRNHTFTQVTDEELQQWKKAVKPVHQKWIDENAGRGPSKMIYETAVKTIEKYNNMK